MKTILLVFLVQANSAFAVHPASPGEEHQIEQYLQDARRHAAVMEQWRDLEKIKAGRIPPPGFEAELDRRLENDPGPAMDMIRAARDERDKAMTRAIELSLTSTGLVAADAQGNPVMPERPVVDRTLSQAVIDKKDGVTWSDGTTYVWPKLDKALTPAALGRLLHHELKHFMLLTDPGKFAMGTGAMEEAVLKEDLKQLGNFGFNANQLPVVSVDLNRSLRKAQLDKIYDDTIRQNERLRRGFSDFIRGNPRTDSPNIESSIPGVFATYKDLQAIRQHAASITEQVRREDQERRQREENNLRVREVAERRAIEEESPRSAYSPPLAQAQIPPAVAYAAQPAIAVQPFDPWQALNKLAQRGCADPWSVPQWEIDADWTRLRGLAYDPGVADHRGLSDCQRNLFLRLLNMAANGSPERLTRDVFAQTAQAARPQEPPPIYDDPGTAREPGVPAVPTCRFHPWCRDWNP